MAFVEFRDVRKIYQMGETQVCAADGLNFDIEQGELACIVGPSGSGKTTLLNMLGGMDTCTSGTITLAGREISAFGEKELVQYRRHEIGFVFQFYNLVQNLTALENVELADAETQLDEAQADIDAIELPDFYVLDRSKNVGAAGHEADASRIDQIARVFPLIFFLVAALVSLTTMTRMVDEERMLIGTYKALGYGNARICSKYLIYALIASGVGSVIGILVLSQFLPQVIMQSYAIIYALPVSVSPVDVPIALVAFGLSVGITLFATLFAALSSLRERPALLMLPRAPKPGKRILLERIGPLWRRLSFSGKVTARNLFRYKRRFFMAIIGIAGCTALLLTGLGLRDGINDIIEKQFGEIQHFNLEVQASDEQSPGDARVVEDILASSDIVTETTHVGGENAIISRGGADKDIRATITVPSDLAVFGDFYTLRERVGHEPLVLDDAGAVITEKLASELGVGVGDSIEIYDQSMVGERDGAAHEVVVSGITEYYTGQGVFMSPEAYEAAMGEPAAFTKIICKAEAPLEERTALSNELLRRGHRDVSHDAQDRQRGRVGSHHRGGVARVRGALQPHEHKHHRAHARDRDAQGARIHTARDQWLHIPRDDTADHNRRARRLRARHRNGELRRGDGRGRRDDVRT